MRPRDKALPAGNWQGTRQDRETTQHSTVPVPARVHTLAHDLAQRDDWADRVAALGLPEAEARAFRVAVLRERTFGARRRPPC